MYRCELVIIREHLFCMTCIRFSAVLLAEHQAGTAYVSVGRITALYNNNLLASDLQRHMQLQPL